VGIRDEMKITSSQLRTLCAIAEAAGREVMAVYGEDFETWNKDDQSPLTQADLRADRVIRQGLEVAFPGVFILSEESSSENAGCANSCFLVDPLDGTREFLKRNGEFTVNIALVYGGRTLAGVVLAPALGELFFAAQGLGSWKRDKLGTHPLRVASWKEGQTLRILGSRSHGGDALAGWLARLPFAYNFVAAGSSLKFCRIAEGLVDLYPRLGPTSQWDTAAGQCILELAGGVVVDVVGNPLRYGYERPLLNPFFIAVADVSLLPLLSVHEKSD
jgi:3'(2'), 5'-bisphosphate nucleotidase